MKLSKREWKMLSISLLLIFCVGIYLYVVSPIHKNYDLAKDENEIVNAQYNAISRKMVSEDEMLEVIEGYRKQIELLESELPSIIHLEEIINVMFNHFEDYGIAINNITFDLNDSVSVESVEDDMMGIEKLQRPLSVEEILDEYETSSNLSLVFDETNSNGEPISYSNISYMAINLNFISNYDVLKEVLEDLENLDLTAITTDLNITKSKNDEENTDTNQVIVNLSLSIPFYYDNEVEKEYIFNYSSDKGDDYIERGPFDYEKIENKEESLEDFNPSDEINSISIIPEFYIGLNSSASDLPAQSLSYHARANSNMTLNSDKSEKYELLFEEKNGEVYFSYENEVIAYPSSGTMKLETINDDIVVHVFSTNRIASDDNASMTLVMNNDTSKKVIFYVYYDNNEKPRFNLLVNKGNFDIIRN